MQDLLKYDPKVLVAFDQALKGNQKVYQWLLTSGYQELAALCSAIHASMEALEWLLENKPEYTVLSNAIDGEKNAIRWLIKANMDFYITFADACQNDKNSIQWLKDNDLGIFVRLAKTISEILVEQRRDSKDYHKMTFVSRFSGQKKGEK